MNQGNGILSNLYSWGLTPGYNNATLQEWLAGLALVLILAFLWSTVVRQTLSEI
jgi:hypothetical protein